MSARTTTWRVDYGLGTTPSSFTAISTTPTSITTGGSSFTNQAVTLTLPSAVENQSGNVWVRIVAIVAAEGSNTRASTGIDDVSLSWTESSCAAPTSPTVGSITSSAATLGWSAPSSVPSGGYDYYYSTTNTAPTGSSTVTNTSSTSAILSLTANTTYYWWVRSNCGAEKGSWVSGGSFTTACTPPNAPSNVITSNVTASTLTVSFTAASPAPSGYMVFLSTTTTVIPTLTHGTTYVEGTDYTIGGHIYKCIISNGSATTYDLINGTPNTQHNYFVFSRSNNICFGAPWYSTGVSGFAITCAVAPTNLSTSSITTTGATFNWINPGSGSAGVTTSKLNIYSSDTYDSSVLVTTVDNVISGHILTTLAPSTTYWYQIVNDNGTCSSLANGGSFATACDAVNVPYSQDFESSIVPAIPNCTTIQNAGTGNDWVTSNSPGNGFTSNTLEYDFNSSNAANAWFYTNGINLIAGTSYRISYKYGNNSTYTEKLKVGYGTTPMNTAMLTILADHPNITGSTPTVNSIDFVPTTSGIYYFGFNAYSARDQFKLFVDDISVIVSPSTLLVNEVSSATLAFGSHDIGSVVPTQSFSVSGANLTGFPSNITVTSPSSAFQVSSDGGATWGATTTVAYSTATLAAQNILVKYIPTACGTASTGDLTFSGGGVTVYPTVSLSGTATLAQPLAIAATAITPNSFTANWNAVSGATGYELEISKSSTFGTGISAIFSEGFESSTFPPTGWLNDSFKRSTNVGDIASGNGAAIADSNNGTLTTIAISNPSSLSFFLGRSNNANAKIFMVEVSTTSQSSGFTTVATYNHSNVPGSSYNQYTVDLSAYSSSPTVFIRFVKTSSTTAPWRLDDIVINYSSQTPSFIAGYGPKIITGGLLASDIVTNLEQNAQYFYRIRAIDGACKSPNSNVISVTTLHDTTTYNGTVPNDWDHGVPVASVNAVINGNYTATGDLSSKTLTINADNTLTLNANTSFTTGDFINNGKLIVESDANFVQNMASNNSGTGDATVKRIANIKRQDYVYWSSPVAGQNLKAFSPGTLNVRFLSYDESTNAFVPIFTATDPSTVTTVFGLGAGYAIRASNSQPNTVQDWLGQFVGNPNNGNVDVDITKNGEGYNLVGNPYPSNINLSGPNGLFTLNSGKTTETAYFWTNVNPNVPATENYDQANYALYSQSGSNPAQNSSVEPTGVVKVGQAFIVQALSTGTLNIRNEMREASATSIFFDKNTSETKDRFWLRLTTPTNDFNTTLIAYVPNATNDFEYGFDANIFGQSSDAIYTKLNSQKLAIQGRQFPLNTKDAVSVGSNHFASGQYKFSISKAEGVFANGQHIYLKDKHTNTITDLTVGDYVFNAAIGTTEGRFEIVYENDIVLATDNDVRKNLIIYRNGDEFIIKSTGEKITEVELYDSLGRLLITVKPNATEARINVSHLSNAFYLLKIDQNGKESSKKIIK